MKSTKIFYSAVFTYIIVGAIILFMAIFLTGIIRKSIPKGELEPETTTSRQETSTSGMSIDPGDLDFLEN